VIGEALKMANTSFNSKERKYKAIILLSDGEDHDPEALNVAKNLASNGVMINTIGIGSPEGSPIVDPVSNELKKDEQGNTVISKLNEVELQQLADATNGRYIRMDNLDDVLITMTQQLDSVEKKSLNDAAFIDYISYFQWFLGIGLVLLLAEYFLPERRRRNLRPAMGVVLLLFGCTLSTSAQKENAMIRSGNRYYKQKQLDKSQQQYEEAVKKAPGNSTANYNLGNAQFRKNSYSDAANSYEASVEHTTDKAMQEKGLYNKGVALVKQQKLQESIDAWKNALKLDASDEDARENLQKALQQLRQQQQSQQEKEKKDQKEKKEQKDKKEENKEQEQPQQPKPQPSRLTKQQVEQYLKTLQQKEKDIQDKMNQNKAKALNQPEKDW
jgi:Ca-activated chloride channel family protein